MFRNEKATHVLKSDAEKLSLDQRTGEGMRLFEKGEISFVFLWVLNPIVILFYQNCAPSQLSQAGEVTQLRAPASQTQVATNSPSSGSNTECSGRQPQVCPSW